MTSGHLAVGEISLSEDRFRLHYWKIRLPWLGIPYEAALSVGFKKSQSDKICTTLPVEKTRLKRSENADFMPHRC